MDPLAHAAEDALLVHPAPALRLEELREILAERVDRTLTDERLRHALELHPERFRILHALKGRTRTGSRDDGEASRREAWVVVVSDAPPPASASRSPGSTRSDPTGRLRESVRWLARGMDGRSALAVGRWYAIVMEEEQARRMIGRRRLPAERLAS